MLNTKALLLSGGGSTFTIRVSASDENGLFTTFSGTVLHGALLMTPVEGSSDNPVVIVSDLDLYNGSIYANVNKSTYPVYKLTIERNSEVIHTVYNATTITAEFSLEPGDVVDIRIRTNSSG